MSSDSTSTDESNWKTSRRKVIAALGAAGVFGAAAAGSTGDASGDLGIGGGPMSNELSHLQIDWHEGPESDLPDPGVEGRFYRVTSGGSDYSAGDVLRDDGNSWNLLNLSVESLNTGEAQTDPVVVSPDPSDDIMVAIAEASLHSDLSQRLVIDLSSGTYDESNDNHLLNLTNLPLSTIEIRGATDNGNPDSILDGGDYTTCVVAHNCDVEIYNCILRDAANNLSLVRGATAELINCQLKDGTSRNINCTSGSTIRTGTDCVSEMTGVAGASFNVEVTGCSVGQLGGEFIGSGGGDQVIRPKQNSWLFTGFGGSTTIDADDTSVDAVDALDAVDLKIQDTSFENCHFPVKFEESCNAKAPSGNSLTNVEFDSAVLNPRKGSFGRGPNEEEIFSLPQNDGRPTTDFDVGGGWADGYIHWNLDEKIPEVRRATGGAAWIAFGRREVSNVSAADLGAKELVHDDNRGGSGNDALIFKASDGNAYYVDFDGSL